MNLKGCQEREQQQEMLHRQVYFRADRGLFCKSISKMQLSGFGA